jgi:hypothetical protein
LSKRKLPKKRAPKRPKSRPVFRDRFGRFVSREVAKFQRKISTQARQETTVKPTGSPQAITGRAVSTDRAWAFLDNGVIPPAWKRWSYEHPPFSGTTRWETRWKYEGLTGEPATYVQLYLMAGLSLEEESLLTRVIIITKDENGNIVKKVSTPASLPQQTIKQLDKIINKYTANEEEEGHSVHFIIVAYSRGPTFGKATPTKLTRGGKIVPERKKRKGKSNVRKVPRKKRRNAKNSRKRS